MTVSDPSAVDSENPPVPAASIIFLRDKDNRMETLLVRRNPKLAVHGGSWVFPGGRLEDTDFPGAPSEKDWDQAVRRAAVREAREEAGIDTELDDLVLFSRWITPINVPKRFDTWFFIAPGPSERVQVDGQEIHEHHWFTPQEALAEQRASRIVLPPPIFVTLCCLEEFADVKTALSVLKNTEAMFFVPRLYPVPDGICSAYQDDPAYPDGDIERPGKRHRLWMVADGWRYERSV